MTRTLIVDDIEVNRLLLEAVFTAAGYDVVSARNGAEAMNLARQSPPGVVVSDILMPVMDGFELCRQWKADARLREIPFIFYTATYTDARDEQFALSLGADRFVLKPQDPAVLGQVVREVLEQRHPWRGGASAKPLREEVEVLREHNEALLRKLAKKVVELAEANVERQQRESESRDILALAQSEKINLQTLIDSISDEVWFADRDKRFTLVNPSGRAAFALSAEDDIEVERLMARLEVLRPDGSPRPVAEAPPLRALRGEWVRDQEEIVRIPASGQLRCRLVNATPVKDAAGVIVGSVSVVRDITERKQTEQAIRDSERKLRDILDNIQDAYFRADRSGRFTMLSPSVARMYGYDSTQELIGQPADVLYADPNARALVLAQMQRSGHVADWVGLGRRRDGSTFWVSLNAQPCRDDSGQVIGTEGVARDITERQRVEEALREKLDELHRWHDVMLDREDRVAALKVEVNELCRRMGEPDRYGKPEAVDGKGPVK